MSIESYLGGSERELVVEKIVEKVGVNKPGRPDGEKLAGGLVRAGDQGEFYGDLEEYDPVLRSHCRL